MERREFKAEYNIEHDKWAIESEQIVDVPLFSAETLMPVPEKSHAQELLDIPIPLENRIAHLLPYIEPVAGRYTQHTIAKKIGAHSQWVVRVAERIGIEPISEMDEGEGVREYPSPSLELLQEEWEWYVAYNALDDQLTAHAIGQFIARDPKWVRRMANELDIHPDSLSMKAGQRRFVYPKSLIPELRHLLLLIPPSEGRLTIYDIVEITGQDWEWIKRQLDASDLIAEKRRSPRDARIFDYYPEESLDYIQKIISERPEAAGDWLTVEGIARLIGKDRDWVGARVKSRFFDEGALRLDDSGKSSIHYPPSVLEELQKEVEALNQYPAVGDYLGVAALAKMVGRDPKWVLKRLPYTAIVAEKRMNQHRQIYDYYPPEAVSTLQALPANILKQPRSEV